MGALWFLGGVVIGILLCLLVVFVLAYFYRSVEPKFVAMHRRIEEAGPRPAGFIIEPDSEAELVRQEIIARNREQGKETRLSELYPD